ncbi:MAG: hypothetical protein HKM04_00570, partial [Legionellales bacterium]|nr:hypothetical protein [Legionellales bacterium]
MLDSASFTESSATDFNQKKRLSLSINSIKNFKDLKKALHQLTSLAFNIEDSDDLNQSNSVDEKKLHLLQQLKANGQSLEQLITVDSDERKKLTNLLDLLVEFSEPESLDEIFVEHIPNLFRDKFALSLNSLKIMLTFFCRHAGDSTADLEVILIFFDAIGKVKLEQVIGHEIRNFISILNFLEVSDWDLILDCFWPNHIETLFSNMESIQKIINL